MGNSQTKEEEADEILDESVTRNDYDSSWSVINVHGQNLLSGLIFLLCVLLLVMGGFAVWMYIKYTSSIHREPPATTIPTIQTSSLIQPPIYDLSLPTLNGLDGRWNNNNRNRAILAQRISDIQQRHFSE